MWYIPYIVIGLILGLNPRFGLLKSDTGAYFTGLLWREAITITASILYGYWFNPANVGVLYGIEWLVVILGALNLIVSWVEESNSSDDATPVTGTVFGVCYALFFLVVVTSKASCMGNNAQTYSRMISGGSEMKTVDYTPAITPVDPTHLRAISYAHANVLMTSNMNQPVPGLPDRTIGSQFGIDKAEMTVQRVRGQLYMAAPLAFRSWGTWNNLDYVGAYLMVPAERTHATAELHTEVNGKPLKMRYMPSAYWASDLQRHLWLSGYKDVRLADFSFEVDDNYRPWWIVTLLKPKVWNGAAEEVKGVLIVDPETGQFKEYALGSIPEWVDRVIPADLHRHWVADWGSLRLGWANANAPIGASKVSLYEPIGETVEVFGDDGSIVWHTMVTTTNEDDDTLVGWVHTDTRTGKSTFFRMTEGGTHVGKLEEVAKSTLKDNMKLGSVVSEAIPAKIYGRWVMQFICDDTSGRFSCFILVDVHNPTVRAIGETRGDVLRNFKIAIARGADDEPGSEQMETVKQGRGKILRLGTILVNQKTTFLITVDTLPGMILRAEVQKETIELPLAKEGDEIVFEYNQVLGEREVTVKSLNDLSIPDGPKSTTSSPEDTGSHVAPTPGSAGGTTKEGGASR